jgi:ribosome biogenesis GTPase / thiamine phosphate phosphatase
VAARIYGALSGVWFWCAQSGAEPLIVGNEADLCDSIGESFDAVIRITRGDAGDFLSTVESVEPVTALVRGRTIALLGSSAAGLSPLANRLRGETRLALGGRASHPEEVRSSARELPF